MRGGRYLNEEQSFLVDDKGYKYVLKEQPDLDSLVVLAKRDRTKNKNATIAIEIVLGILTFPLMFIGVLFFIVAYVTKAHVDDNNKAQFECVYYDEKKNTIIFRTMKEKLWLEFAPERINDVFNIDTDDVFGLNVQVSEEYGDVVYFSIGYTTQEEKSKLSKRIKMIKEGKFDSAF